MTPQSTFLVLAPVAEGRMEDLRALVDTMTAEPGWADPENPVIPFGRFDRIHFARVFILEIETWRDIKAYGVEAEPYPPQLALMGEIDGDRESFLKEFARVAGDGIRELFSHCDGFDPGGDLAAWMRRRNIDSDAGYVNMRGRTVRQVHEERALRKALSERLRELEAERGAMADPYRLHEDLAAFVRQEQQEGRLWLTPEAPTPIDYAMREWAEKLGVPLLALLASPLVIAAAPFVIWRLRQLEKTDPVIAPRPPDERIAMLTTVEDRDVTNAFAAAGDVKPGLFRRGLATVLLYAIDWGAKHIYGRGYLARVQSIHFARWVYLDDKRRLMFCSNYDGTLESYRDDFINKVAWGLNLIFSNGVGWPRTRWLVKGGAEHEQDFKQFFGNRQIPVQVWYKAYPGLSAFDLYENTVVRKGLEKRPQGARALRQWLARL